MNVELIPLKAEHLDLIEKRPEIFAGELYYVNHKKMALIFEQHPSATVLLDGEIIFCGGIVSFWPNTGEAWLVTIPGIRQHKTILYDIVNNFISMTSQALGLKRLQALVQEDFEAAQRFVKNLGFNMECSMKNYFGDKTYILYAIIREN